MPDPRDLARTGGGLASIVAGGLLFLGHLADLGGDPAYGTVVGGSLVLAAHILLVFVLVALYAAQAGHGPVLNGLALVLGVVGTTLNCAAIFVEIAGAGGADVAVVLTSGPTGTLTLPGGLAFLIALILFGVAIMRAGVLRRWTGLVLILGDVVFGAGSFAGSAQPLVSVAGAALTGGALVGLGVGLLRRARSAAVGALQSGSSPA
jgi:hypothetical protein